MSTEKPHTQDLLISAIKHEIDRTGKELMIKAIDDVKKEMERRTPEIIAGVTVHVMSMCEFQTMTDRVVFTIRKQDTK